MKPEAIRIVLKHLRAAETELKTTCPPPYPFPSQDGESAKLIADAIDLAVRIEKSYAK